MKTTSQKLLTSLLALGLTSSAGLYAQNSTTIPAAIGTPFVFGPVPNGVNFYAPANEDLDADNNFDIGEDANNDGIFNNGGIGPGEGALLNEFVDQVDYDGDGVIDATNAIAQLNLFNEDLNGDAGFDRSEDLDGDGRFDIVDEDANGNGVLDLGEDLDNDGNFDRGLEDIDGDGNFDLRSEDALNDQIFQRHEDLDGDGNFDNVDEDANGNGILDAGLNEFVDQVDYDGDGVIDATNAIALQNLFNEDLDEDGNFDRGVEDANGNGVFDNGLNRTYLEALNPITGARQDLDILVANGLFVNGEMVATENYVDAADARLQGQIDQNRSAIRKNSEDIETNTRGIAMVAALQHTTVLPGMTNAFDLSAAYFEGETGLALNFARRLSDNVQINFGAASTTDFDESVIKAGIGVQW